MNKKNSSNELKNSSKIKKKDQTRKKIFQMKMTKKS